MTSIRLSLACVVCAALAATVPASASAKPDLTVAKLTSAKASVRGAPLSTAATVRGSGAVPRPTSVGFFLSTNRTISKKDKALVGGEFVPALGRGKSSARKAVVYVPSTTKPGRYFLLACADVRKQVKETSEKNNCRASKSRIRVRKAPAPVKVKPHLSGTGAVSEVVSADAGGTLSTSGPDGSTYKLEIPAQALVSDETVTMTPVASVGGLPFAGAVAGVDLKPEGLMLTKAARLTIAAASPPPAGRGLTVGWHAGGEGFHLEPLSRESGVVLDIDHFSGYELAKGTPAQVASQLQRPPIRTQEQLDQAVFQATLAAKEAVRAGDQAEAAKWGDNLVPIYLSYYDNTIKDLLSAARTDDALAPAAVTEALSWVRQMQAISLIGNPDEPGNADLKARVNDVFTQLGAILRNALNRAGDRCLKGDLAQVHRLQALERLAQQLGADAGDSIEKVRRCLHFELDYDGTWQVRQTAGDNAPDNVTDFTTKIAGLKINGRVTPSEVEPEASQALNYPTYTFSGNNGCAGTLASKDEPALFRAVSLDVSAGLIRTVGAGGRSSFKVGPPKVTLQVDPGQRTENVPYNCSGGGGSTQHNHHFDSAFKLFHSSEGDGIYKITGWTQGTGGILATKTYKSGLTAGGFFRRYSEMSTFRLRHTPAG